MSDPVWLFDRLKADKEIRVESLAGWQNAGHGDFKDIRGIMFHHTGNSRETAASIRKGRSDLPGPLSQLHIAPDGVVTVVAVGVSWHAGTGSLPWVPANMGNWHLIGVECAWPFVNRDGSYSTAHPWPRAQILAMRNVAAVVCRELRVGADRVTTHKEYAGRSQGKWDPGNFDPRWFRGEVSKDLSGFIFPGEGTAVVTPPPVPPVQPPVDQYAGVLLYPGIVDPPAVRKLQAALKRRYSKLVIDGIFGRHTTQCVRGFQGSKWRIPPLVVDGIVGPATAAQLDLVL